MKKITDFIVDKRYIILFIFIGLTIWCAFLSSKVKINYDMVNYLPSSSSTKKGMDIMNDEFNSTSSSLNIMVKDLDENEKKASLDYLKSLDNVSSVEYDDSKKYNHEEYTLYILTVDAKADSKKSSVLYDTIKEHFAEKLVDTSGDVSSYNKTVLPFYVVVLAVISALIILIIMCESYIEPFLFLASILIAVVLNNGTNIIFDRISNITSSISAILQMALSMDYSIMLMNRYRQERFYTDDKKLAMKKALNHAFKAITSSSVTTIVGLLALVFMSFTIGRDLGFVLAKGVLFSLISIFTCLPCFILAFDKLIIKTKKKSPNIKMNLLGKLSYKCRYVALILFIVIFIASYFLRGNLGYLYTTSGTDDIDKEFNLNNQMAVVYPSNEDEKITKVCKSLEKNERIDDVLCYGNTINLPLKYNNLNAKLEDLGTDKNIKDYLLKIVYYHYYNSKENNKMTLNQFVSFIEDEIYKNEKMNKKIDSNMKSDLNRLHKLVNKQEVSKIRTKEELANTLNIDVNLIEQLKVYYNSKHLKTKISVSDFVNFINKSVLTDKEYAKNIDNQTKSNLKFISNFTDKNVLLKNMSSQELANLFSLNSNDVNQLYLYYLLNTNPKLELTINEFSSFVKNNILTNKEYSKIFSDEQKSNLELLNTFSNTDFITEEMDTEQLSENLDIPKQLVEFVFMRNNVSSLSIYNFVKLVLSDDTLKPMLKDNIDKLQTLYFIMDSSINKVKYDYQKMGQSFNIDSSVTKQIYSLYLLPQTKMSPKTFVDFIILHQNDEQLKGAISNKQLTQLSFVQKIINNVLANRKNSKDEMAKLLNNSSDNVALIYSLYEIKKEQKKVDFSFESFISFLNNDVMKNNEYQKKFDKQTKNKLISVNNLIKDALKNREYTKEEVLDNLKVLNENLDKDLIALVYIYYGSVYQYDNDWSLTIEQFSNYLNDNIIKDKRFSDYIDEDMKKDIVDSKSMVKDAKDLLIGEKYSRVVLNTSFKAEDKETFNFISNLKKEVPNAYVVGDSLVAYEMSETFSDEMNFITILTMIFIFTVVIVTFKSLLIPIILVLLIQCSVFLTMGILSFSGSVYFISILIVQSILMGATIDYAILYTSYYLESRKKMDIKQSIVNAYQSSIHTILNSALILIIVTLIVGRLSSTVSAKICTTISQGTLCSAILIIFLLPAVLAACDKYIKGNYKK